MGDRGQDTSRALTEVRTVLSRAETCLDWLASGPSEYEQDYDADAKKWVAQRFDDEDQELMTEAMRKVVVALAQWRKSGARRRGR